MLLLFSLLLGRIYAFSDGVDVVMQVELASSLVFLAADELSFGGVEAQFGERVKDGVEGIVRVLGGKGCHALGEGMDAVYGGGILVIERGDCPFEVKVYNAQMAGYAVAVVYNNETEGKWVTMVGDKMENELRIASLFLKRKDGLQLVELARRATNVGMELKASLKKSFLREAVKELAEYMQLFSHLVFFWTTFVLVFAAMSLVYSIRHVVRSRKRKKTLKKNILELINMRRVTEKDSLISEEAVCTICFDAFKETDVVRDLPCRHTFHAVCVDPWLSQHSCLCPICKRDTEELLSKRQEIILKSAKM